MRGDLAVVRVAIDPVPTFRAGQYVTVEIPQRRGWWRHLSPAGVRWWRHLSPAGVVGADGVAEFHVRAVRGGWVSPALDELHALDRLCALARENPALTVVPVAESPWGSEEHVAEVQVGTLAEVVPRFGAWTDREILLSGPPAMLHITVDAMLAARTPLGNLHHDAFW
ncbi:MAG TPA: hypothetical protein VGH76_00355 [Actinomycetospora sp.]|uniref:hypothetical protein n=1 Tax=Actinomycetospora sp. TaxID=1872135 RepID=UPI002F423B5D